MNLRDLGRRRATLVTAGLGAVGVVAAAATSFGLWIGTPLSDGSSSTTGTTSSTGSGDSGSAGSSSSGGSGSVSSGSVSSGAGGSSHAKSSGS